MEKITDLLREYNVEYVKVEKHLSIPSKKVNIIVWDITDNNELTEAETKKFIRKLKNDDYDVIMFYSDEISNKWELCSSMLKNKLGFRSSVVYRASDLDFKEIKRLRSEGIRTRDICKQFEISRTTAAKIFSGKSWGHVI